MFGGNSGGGFNELLQEAAKIKGAQMATMRTEFDSWPVFFQNTLFHGQSIDVVKEGRTLPCKERLESANKIKDEGTAAFKKLDFNTACTKYEHAIAMFHYIYPNRDDWKKRGIKDEDMEMVNYIGDKDSCKEDRDAVKDLKTKLYTNIATCHFQSKNWALSVRACNYALKVDENNVKALYRRAMSNIKAPSAGGMEIDSALGDLKKAHKLEPDNIRVKRELGRLKQTLKKQKLTDKSNYSGLFQRGEICLDETTEKRIQRKQIKSKKIADENKAVLEQIQMWKRQAEALEADGRTKEADDLWQKYNDAMKVVEQFNENNAKRKAEFERGNIENMDFLNPTEKMISDAKKNGIDLMDPAVQSYMAELQERKLNCEPLESDFLDGKKSNSLGKTSKRDNHNKKAKDDRNAINTSIFPSGRMFMFWFVIFFAIFLGRYYKMFSVLMYGKDESH
jgi:hypothetical protein